VHSLILTLSQGITNFIHESPAYGKIPVYAWLSSLPEHKHSALSPFTSPDA